MNAALPIKDILYQELSKITDEQIKSHLTNKNSSTIIRKIISKCYPKILKDDINIDENTGILAEALMHYLLTLAQIPSQRKIIHNNVEIDLVLPDIKNLKLNPKNTIIICIPKTGDIKKIQKKIKELEKIQSKKENIWIVLHKPKNIKLRTYIVNIDGTIDKIIDHLEEFFSVTKQSKLKILKS